jgi:hypothetical protein
MLKQTLWHLAQSEIARAARDHEWTRIHLESAGRWAAWELNQDPTRDVTAELTRAFQDTRCTREDEGSPLGVCPAEAGVGACTCSCYAEHLTVYGGP